MAHNHDTGYKRLFSHPEMVRDLIAGFIDDDWLHSLDYSTLERVSGSYITDDLRERSDDVVWRVRADGQWMYLYLLIEFQSRVDRYMALRMMVYVGLLYQDLLRRNELLDNGLLPPVLPIVLYNGTPEWTAAPAIQDLIPDVPGLVAHYKPQLSYLLVAENRYSSEQLASLKNLVAAVFRIESPNDPNDLLAVVRQLTDWLSGQLELKRTLSIWLHGLMTRRSKGKLALPIIDDLQEMNAMLAERMEEWAQNYVAQGMQQGMQRGLVVGEREMLMLVLEQKFGPLSASYRSRVDTAESVQLKHWLTLALTVSGLESVFQDSAH